MNPHLWIAFAAASLVMGLIPGPGVMSIVGYALGSGRRTALASVAGMALGNVTAMSLSVAGVGALLAASALAFSILKWIGALYLIGLGVAAIVRSDASAKGEAVAAISPGAAFFSNIAVGTFHPKTIIFFVAFAPQFISSQGDYAVQAAILVATFGLVVGATDTLYALAGGHASRLLKRPGTTCWSKRVGGGVLIAAGVATAAAHKG
jgi:threonine/homoserine/homoserine lactone efflux protein